MELKERIINEASRMFIESGIKSVRMDDIAAACGISKRTLYENFTDREDLIRQSLAYHISKYNEYVGAKLEGSDNVIDEFWEIFGGGSDFAASGMKVFKDLMKFYPKIFKDFLHNHHTLVIENNRERLERGIAEGFILKNINTEYMARAFTNYIYGLRKDITADIFSYNNDDISFVNDNNAELESLRFSVLLFFRGMTTEKGRRYIDETYLKGIL